MEIVVPFNKQNLVVLAHIFISFLYPEVLRDVPQFFPTKILQ